MKPAKQALNDITTSQEAMLRLRASSKVALAVADMKDMQALSAALSEYVLMTNNVMAEVVSAHAVRASELGVTLDKKTGETH